ncbi:MAG: hypothetical protein S4CHLAM7_02410 [Chlamydiae bacterium]|nr:hypothetical protein [Chlamydiota bacterium]
MRIDVQKFLLFGPSIQKKEFFRKAQQLGVIEFIDHSGQKYDIVPEPVKKMNKALRVLRGVPILEQSDEEDLERASAITEEILGLHAKHQALFEEKRLINQEMTRVAVFGDFNYKDVEFIQNQGHREVQFFFSKHRDKVPEEAPLIYVGKDHDLYYFIGISREKIAYENMVEMIVEKSFGELSFRKNEIINEIHEIEQKLKELSRFKSLVKKAVIHSFNEYYLKMNHNFVSYHWEESFFSTEVWISKTKVKEVERLLESFSIFISQIENDENDKIPTHLENTGPGRLGEDLVYIYDTPSINDKDPSTWVLWAFALFFAFIVGDGGYGFVFLSLFFLIRWKVKKPTDSVKRFNKLLGILSVSCIVWGFFVSSFFGINFSLESGIKRYAPISYLVEKKLSYHMSENDQTYQETTQQFPDLKKVRLPYEFLTQAVKNKDGVKQFVVYDQFANNVMLELALFIGTIHLIFSMLRGMSRSWARVGWIFFLVGAYLYFPESLKATSLIHYAFGIKKVVAAFIGPYILLGGVGLAVLLGFIQNKLKGAAEIMTIIEVFADVLSYLRLYALALAGSIMANTFNSFGLNMPIAIGIVVILVGHALNIVLSVMGGVIHGLRLNFLEWYHYSFEGEGKKHTPLALLKFRK